MRLNSENTLVVEKPVQYRRPDW